MEHYQFYFCLVKPKRKKWLLKHIHKDAFYEVKRGTVAEAIDYCQKTDTHKPGGLRFEHGEIPVEQSGLVVKRSKEEVEDDALTILELMKQKKYMRIEEISPDTLMHGNFLKVYQALAANQIGQDRHVNIFCIIGPRGCGKSHAYRTLIKPDDRAIFTYEGHGWALNGWAPYLILDEYMGQLGIARELRMLDEQAGSLEVKHGFAPAMYHTVIICSNKPPTDWHKGGLAREMQLLRAQQLGMDTDDFSATPEQCNALFDRIGIYYGQPGYWRQCGHYLELSNSCVANTERLKQTQAFVTKWLQLGLEGKLPPGNFSSYESKWKDLAVDNGEPPAINRVIPPMTSKDLSTWTGPRTEQGAPLLGAFIHPH
nr:MAG: rep protein [Cressdnaviricota sp.]